MSSTPQAQQFLAKLEELRAVFVLGRRSFPFLEQLFSFVQDITLLLEEVDAAIRAQTGDMPRATSQLKSVSEATELATNEILDLTDGVLHTLKGLEEGLETSSTCFEQLAEADVGMRELLRDELGEERPSLVARAERIFENKAALREEGKAEVAAAREALAPIRTKMNHIMMSLQVQDITAQQIASVNHLIESVRSRMDDLLQRFGSGYADARSADAEGAAPEASPEEAPENATFDWNASYDRSPARQQQADDLVAALGNSDKDGAAHGDGAPPEVPAEATMEATSQADIDDLFENGGVQAETHDVTPAEDASDSPTSDEGAARTVASQEDIDALFQQGL